MYSNASIQYVFDENVPNNRQDILNQDKISPPAKSNEGFQMEMVKEEKGEEEFAGKFSEAVYVGDGLRRSSGVSDFNDIECGEPAAGQHLRINFAITEEDNIELENKCRSFWKFIKCHPHLEKIKVLPMNDVQSTSVKQVAVVKENVLNEDKSATEWVQRDDMIKSAIATKLKTSYCSLERGDYCDGSKNKRRDTGKIRADKQKGLEDKFLSGSSRVSSTDDLKTICQCMDEWDADHPRTCVEQSFGFVACASELCIIIPDGNTAKLASMWYSPSRVSI